MLGRVVAITLLLSAVDLWAQPEAPPANPPRWDRADPIPQAELADDEAPLVARQWLAPYDDIALLSAVDTLRERAEDLSGVTVQPPDPVYSVVQSEIVAEGTNAFHLAHPPSPDLEPHHITLNTPIAPETNTYVFFESRLRSASSNQTARFEISTDAGASWTTLWSRAGTGSGGQEAFELVSVDLGSYAGQELLLRFHYALSAGSVLVGTNTTVGWIIDDIQVGTEFVPRAYTGFGDPSPEEILSVEFINRARADAMEEAARLRDDDDPYVTGAIDFFDVDLDEMEAQFATLEQHLPPLAINAKLTTAARLHNQDMFDNVFQGHTSSDNPPPPNQPGDSASMRATRQSYNWTHFAENVYAYALSVWHGHAAFNIDWGSGTWHGMQDPPGHREAIHSASYREVGVGVLEGSNSDNGDTVGPMLKTQVFGRESGANHPFLVGVTHVDADTNGFYSIGEGLGGVRVEVEGVSYYAESSTHGAYAIPLPGDGTYEVIFSASGYLTETQQVTVANGENVKLDYAAQLDPDVATLQSVERLTGDAIEMTVSYGGVAADIAVEYSTDLVTWIPLAATVTDEGGGEYRVETDPPNEGLIFLRLIRDQ